MRRGLLFSSCPLSGPPSAQSSGRAVGGLSLAAETKGDLMVTKVQAIPTDLAEAAESYQHGSIGIDTSGLEQPNSRVHSATVRHMVSFDGTPGGRVLSTLDHRGGQLSVELEPGNPSTRTSVDVAIREGLLTRDAAGNLQDTTNQQEVIQQATKAPETEHPQADPGAGIFDPEDDQAWAADIDPLPQHAYDAAVASVIATTALGHGDLDQTAKALASNAGIEPELAREYVEQGYTMYERTVARALAPLGLEGERLEQAYEFMRQQPERLQNALQQLVHARDVSAFKALGVAFKVANPPDMSAYKAAGFETFVDRETGDLLMRPINSGGAWQRLSDVVQHASTAASATSTKPAPAKQEAAPRRSRAGMMVDPVSGDWITEDEYWGR